MSLRSFERPFQSPADIPPTFFSALTARIISVLSGATAPPIDALEQKLTGIIRQVLAGTQPAIVGALREPSHSSEAAQAFILGQLSFAQQLAASAAITRADESFIATLSEKRWQAYLRRLLQGECTNVDLAKATQQADETVSRKVKELRALGVTDFRKEGTFVFNFLTPAARQILMAQKEQGDLAIGSEYDSSRGIVDGILTTLRDAQPEYMQHALTFGASHGR